MVEQINGGNDFVTIDGNQRHVISYLQDFLFTAERTRLPVKFLSGGERNRLLLAKLFARPANVLVLDEPTNDLDLETLELLEQRLVDFQGTVLVVSHDREFLDNVATSLIAFEPGGVREYVVGIPIGCGSAAVLPCQRSVRVLPTGNRPQHQMCR